MGSQIFPDTAVRARLPDWEMRLFTWLNHVRSEQFKYGTFDCAIGLAAGAVKAQTDVDLGLPHLGKYKSKTGAKKYMVSQGWRSLPIMGDSFLRRISANTYHRGNIVLLESDLGPAFGIRTGSRAIAFSVSGLKEFPIPANSIEWSPL